MDNYPEHLAPEFEESGAVKTPFEKWWETARGEFANVPEDVARQWLHRHWAHSPYRYLSSKNYAFTEAKWQNLRAILTSWSDFGVENKGALNKGKELVNLKPGWMPYVAQYMREHRRFPAPIIVLDNRDNHHDADYPEEHALPAGHILIEGHTRLNVGMYLETVGKLEQADVWIMKKIPASKSGFQQS